MDEQPPPQRRPLVLLLTRPGRAGATRAPARALALAGLLAGLAPVLPLPAPSGPASNLALPAASGSGTSLPLPAASGPSGARGGGALLAQEPPTATEADERRAPTPTTEADEGEPSRHPAEAPAGLAERELARRLDRLFDDPALLRAHAGMVVQEAGSGRVLYRRAAERRFTSASAAKLVTAAVALQTLGPGFRWRTRLLAEEPPREGAIPGDLWIVGGGDPGIGPEALAAWAGRLRRAGVRRIAGDLVGDGRALEGPMWGRGWMWEDVVGGWGVGVSGLQMGPARVRARLVPAPDLGEPAALEFPDGLPPLPLLHDVRTGTPGSEARLRWMPDPDEGTPRLEGWIPPGAPVPLLLAPADPTAHLLERFLLVLADSGVAVEGAPRRPTPAERPPESPGWSAEVPSDSLGALLPRMLKPSDNEIAETLLRTLGREAGEAATDEAGLAVVEATVARWGIPPGALSLADGSGLSRYSEASPAALARILRRVRQLPFGELFAASLPVGGVDGTLAARFLGTAGEANVRAKTGSLSGVRALAGYVHDARGEPLVFALLLNGYDAPGAVARALEELVVEQLALFGGPGYVEPEAGADGRGAESRGSAAESRARDVETGGPSVGAGRP